MLTLCLQIHKWSLSVCHCNQGSCHGWHQPIETTKGELKSFKLISHMVLLSKIWGSLKFQRNFVLSTYFLIRYFWIYLFSWHLRIMVGVISFYEISYFHICEGVTGICQRPSLNCLIMGIILLSTLSWYLLQVEKFSVDC